MTPMKKQAQLLTPAEVGKLLKVSPRTVAKWCREGKLPARKIGRVWRIHDSPFLH